MEREKKQLIDSQIRSQDESEFSSNLPREKPVNMTFVYMIMALMLLTGSANTIVLKIQDDTIVEGKGYTFQHPYFQSITMFFGELLCLPVYYCIMHSRKKDEVPSSPNTQLAQKVNLKSTNNPFILGCPAFLDFFGSTIMFVALALVPASIYQMMRGFIVVIACFFSILFLKKKYFRHHWLGVIIVTIGIILVGIAAAIWGKPEKGKSGGSIIVGIVLLIIAQFFAATQFITEAKLLQKYYAHPMKLVGCEGLIGFCTTIVFLILFQFIPCPNKNVCGQQFKTIEDSILAIQQLVKPVGILGCTIGIFFSIAFFNFFGVSVTKYSSPAHRAVVDSSRTVLIWIFFLALGDEHFILLQLIGFLVLTLGSLIFNEVLKVPFCKFNAYTADKLKSRKTQEGLVDTEEGTTGGQPDYITTSPATYDAGKIRKRLLQKYEERERNKGSKFQMEFENQD